MGSVDKVFGDGVRVTMERDRRLGAMSGGNLIVVAQSASDFDDLRKFKFLGSMRRVNHWNRR